MVKTTVSFGVLLALLSVATSAAAAPLAPPAPEDGYRISVLTFGHGDDFVALGGHDALLVERAGLPALVYDFGMYTDAAIAPHHVIGGTLRYFLSVDYFERTLASYRAENRSVLLQVLALDRATAERLADALSENSKPGNTDYAYDFTRDNCATRVRDAIDRALGGSLHAQLRGPAPLTYREHALRLTADDFALYFLFDLGLGKTADRPLDGWQNAFLPDELAAALRRIRVDGPGGSRLLVARESTLVSAARAPTRDEPPVRAPWHALAGAGLGALLFVVGRSAQARVGFGLAAASLGALFGVLGLWILGLALTNVHSTSHDNFNLLISSPWALGMIPGGLLVAFGRARGFAALSRRALESMVIALLGLLLAAAFGQDSLRVALLVVPPLAGVWLGARAAPRARLVTPP